MTETLQKQTTTLVSIVVGLAIAAEKVGGLTGGNPLATWLPQFSFGLGVAAFAVAIAVGTTVGPDPNDVGWITPAHWIAVGGFVVFALLGAVYVAAGYAAIMSWGHLAVGVGGLLLLGWEYRHR